MSFGRRILLAAAGSDRLNAFATRSRVVKRATRKFMPGEKPEDALAAGRAIAREGRGIIYTQLGEAINSLTEAEAVRDHYLWFTDQMVAAGLDAHISVKPTQLGLDQSFDQCMNNLSQLAEKSKRVQRNLWLDMEDSSYVDRTIRLYEGLQTRHGNIGVALQAYLYRTPDDVARLLAVKPTIRLVKGAYNEPATVAYAQKKDTDAAYLNIGKTLLDAARAGNCRPIFGTHDMKLVNQLATQADSTGGRKSGFEVHMLYGIGDEDQRALVRDGFTVKTLISYGSAWYRWYMRRLAERPANVGFLLRSMFGA